MYSAISVSSRASSSTPCSQARACSGRSPSGIAMSSASSARCSSDSVALGQGAYHIDDAAILHTVSALEAVFRSAEADGAWQMVE